MKTRDHMCHYRLCSDPTVASIELSSGHKRWYCAYDLERFFNRVDKGLHPEPERITWANGVPEEWKV